MVDKTDLKSVELKARVGSSPTSGTLDKFGGISSVGQSTCLARRGSWVRIPHPPLCNDSETSDGTDAKNEMETFETRTKEWMRHKPYSHYKTYMPVWRNDSVYSYQTYLIRSGGVTEKDPVKVTNPSTGTFGLVAQLVRAKHS